jgi:hypothetical protein
MVDDDSGFRGFVVGSVIDHNIGKGIVGIANLLSTKKSPACAEMVKREAKVCKFCRYDFTREGK